MFPWRPGRDYWWHDLMALPIARARGGGNRCETEVMDAEDPLFHALHLWHNRASPRRSCTPMAATWSASATTLKWVFDMKEEDRWWCAADPGLDHRS